MATPAERIDALITELTALRAEVKQQKPRRVSEWQKFLTAAAQQLRDEKVKPTRERIYERACKLSDAAGYIRMSQRGKSAPAPAAAQDASADAPPAAK